MIYYVNKETLEVVPGEVMDKRKRTHYDNMQFMRFGGVVDMHDLAVYPPDKGFVGIPFELIGGAE